MLKSCVAAAAIGVAVFSSHAEARQWYVVDFSNDTCHGINFTPDQFERGMRDDPNVVGPPNVYIKKDDNGNVLGVSVTSTYRSGNSGRMYFTTTYPMCEWLREELIREGQLTRRSDLQ